MFHWNLINHLISGEIKIGLIVNYEFKDIKTLF